MATDSFRFIPPLKSLENVFLFSNNATSSMLVSTDCSNSSFDFLKWRPLTFAKNSMCSLTVRSGKRQSCCKQIPTPSRMSLICVRMSFPATKAVPDEGATIPVSMEMVVVLPAPLCPKRAVTWPLYIDKDSPSTAVFVPKVLDRFRSCTHRPSFSCSFKASDTGSIGIKSFSTAAVSSTAWLASPPHQYAFWKGKYQGNGVPKSLGTTRLRYQVKTP
mmetsp:Transcript_19975/g.36281  ORF Transcript_19975/g.36281 Transcript_19975/m.36281 type:complete len:217 (-) Transcript_19975:1716-2366(-)